MSEENTEQNTSGSNNSGNPSLASPLDNATNGAGRPSRNVTVTIQYSYLTPDGLANLTPNGLANLAFPNGNVLSPNNAANQMNGDIGANPETEGSQTTRPDGALILSFSDVPSGTPQERLESIVSIAAELAMRRFSDMVTQSKGITKEQFERLPVLRVDDLQDKGDSVCSICYEKYEDENINILKRTRDAEEKDNFIKRQRSESPIINIDTDPQNQADGTTSAAVSSSSNNPTDIIAQSDDDTSSYKHCPIQLPCGHVFGRECLYRWSRMENSCPLCRAPLVEVSQEESRNSNSPQNNSSAEVFERIRQLVYSPALPSGDQRPIERDEGVMPETVMSNTNGSGGLHTADTLETQPFSFSRSGIVFLRPDSRGTGLGAPNNESESRLSGASLNSNISETTTDNIPGTSANEGESNNTANQASGNTPTDTYQSGTTRIQWIPIPITTIRLGGPGAYSHSNNNNSNDDNNRDNADSNNSNNNDNETDNNTDNDSNNDASSENNQSTHGDALRSILDRIFSVTHAENTRRQQSSSTENSSSNSQENITSNLGNSATERDMPRSSLNSAPPRRRSFLQNILRITNRSRNRARNDINRTNQTELHTYNDNQQNDSADLGNMFNSGVASYRNQDGRVSTFNIGQGPLPVPPRGNRSSSNNSGTQTESNSTQGDDNESSRQNAH